MAQVCCVHAKVEAKVVSCRLAFTRRSNREILALTTMNDYLKNLSYIQVSSFLMRRFFQLRSQVAGSAEHAQNVKTVVVLEAVNLILAEKPQYCNHVGRCSETLFLQLPERLCNVAFNFVVVFRRAICSY